MNRILAILRDTDQPVLLYVVKAGLIALLPSLALAVVVGALLPAEGPKFEGSLPGLLFGVLVLSPWLETLLLWPMLWLLKRFLPSHTAVAWGGAICWGLLHSLAAPAWGLIIWWPFFVFSACFLAWQRFSTRQAIVVTALVHTFQNVIPALALIASR